VIIGGAIVTWIFIPLLPSGGSVVTHIAMHILTENTATTVTSAMKWDSTNHTNRVLYAGRNTVQVHVADGSDG